MAAIAESNGSGTNPVDATERILQDNPDRYCMFPIHYDNMWRGFKKTETTFWTAEGIDLCKDPTDWRALSHEERSAVGRTLAYLVTSDALLLENLALRFLSDVEQPEARAFYSFQVFKQGIHVEAYGQIITTLLVDEEEQAAVFRAMRAHPLLQRKVEWAKKWLMSFCSFFWLKKRGVLPGVTFANDLISRDEGINVEFAGIIYSELQHKLPQDRLQEIVGEAVKIEKEFASEGIPVGALGLDPQDMAKYIEFVGDQLASTLGHDRFYKASNPYGWLESIALKGTEAKVHSLENKTANMSTASVLKQVEERNFTLNFDEDF